jgi:hypothetical protein
VVESAGYGRYGSELALLASSIGRGAWPEVQQDVHAALNGQASQMLRTLVPRDVRRREGAFFTSGQVRAKFGALLAQASSAKLDVPYWDPTCGAGDLLLEASDSLPLEKTFPQTIRSWGTKLHGHDTQSAFVEAARLRLFIAAAARHRSRGDQVKVGADGAARSFPRVQVGDGLAAMRAMRGFRGHLLLNPPFGYIDAEPGWDWSTGLTSQAGVFFLAAAEAIAYNRHITAVLPDVLRSGSRYDAWRSRVESLVTIERIAIHGQFDDHTDVDVFLLNSRRTRGGDSKSSSARWWPELTSEVRVGDVFEVRVGPVVDNRDPREGTEVPFLIARDIPVSGEIGTPERCRRFGGRLVSPPFVVIRRTSRPGPGVNGSSRIAGVIVRGSDPVAVDNHLITLQSKEGGVEKCLELLNALDSLEVKTWLDERIRCRHMTVEVVRSLPWRLQTLESKKDSA